jgi:hypothetical protein
MKTLKYFFIALTITILLGAIINAIFFSKETTPEGVSSASAVDNAVVDSSLIPAEVDTSMLIDTIKKKWLYTEREDKMTSKSMYFAKIEADELLQFKSPYDGGATATFVIRYNGEGFGNIYLTISQGQFMTHSSGTYYRVRFDESEAKSYKVSTPSDGSSTLVFFSYYDLLDKIKKSKKMLIQAEFYQEGLRTMEFNISNLKWEH